MQRALASFPHPHNSGGLLLNFPLSKLREELPNIWDGKAVDSCISPVIPRQRNVICVKCGPLRRIARVAAGVDVDDVLSAVASGFAGLHRRAAIVLDEAVADLAATVDGEDAVADAVLAIEGDGVVSAVAAGED
jgi:hypothetical protein